MCVRQLPDIKAKGAVRVIRGSGQSERSASAPLSHDISQDFVNVYHFQIHMSNVERIFCALDVQSLYICVFLTCLTRLILVN